LSGEAHPAMFTIQTTVECYLLPGDGDAARAKFLEHLKDPHEMWIIAYSFTLAPMIDEIIANAAGGDPIHIYLDYSQSKGKFEMPQVQRLIDAGVEVTIGTSPAGTSYITHTKGFVCDDTPLPFCWEGSVNFSASGWMQVNTAMIFNNQTWRDQFVQQFDALRDYAWTNERSYQLLKTPPAGVTIGPSTSAGATVAGTATKSATKKASAKKTPAKKASATKARAKKTSAKKTPAKKASATKTSAKKASAKKKGPAKH